MLNGYVTIGNINHGSIYLEWDPTPCKPCVTSKKPHQWKLHCKDKIYVSLGTPAIMLICLPLNIHHLWFLVYSQGMMQRKLPVTYLQWCLADHHFLSVRIGCDFCLLMRGFPNFPLHFHLSLSQIAQKWIHNLGVLNQWVTVSMA